MYQLTALLLLLLGIAQLSVGIYLYYAFLPLWYGLFGATLGIALSQSFYNETAWAGDPLTWVLVATLTLALGFSSYRIEPYRRYFVGALIGAVLGLLVASMLAVGPLLAIVFAIAGGGALALLSQIIFDPLLVIGSSLIGATLVLDSIFLLTHWSWVNRYAGEPIAMLLWTLLAVMGITWQFGQIKNIGHVNQVSQAT